MIHVPTDLCRVHRGSLDLIFPGDYVLLKVARLRFQYVTDLTVELLRTEGYEHFKMVYLR
jgi:hypothetical protein